MRKLIHTTMTESDEKRLEKNDIANITVGYLELCISRIRQIQSISIDGMSDVTLKWMKDTEGNAEIFFKSFDDREISYYR